IISVLGAINFYVNLSNDVVDVVQGEPNATEKLTDLLVTETVDSVRSELIWAVLIAVLSIAGGALATLKTILK
ncbi:MAG: hypothetical protein NWF06_04995, partial [Candidatus Bathyarchaeota archaeon]|nr:hypothetical protein [Candidatus Bathyarchaeum sp.]